MNSIDDGARRGLFLFFIATFLVSWGAWLIAIVLGGSPTSSPTVIPYLLGGFGPLVGAGAVRFQRARRRRPAPLQRVRSRGWRLIWVLPLLATGGATVLCAALLAPSLGGPALDLDPGLRLVAQAGGPIGFLVTMLIAGPLPEEPGWRGTAYPRLRARMGRLNTLLVLGMVWAVWHLPLFFIQGTMQADFGLASWGGVLFFLSFLPMTVLTAFGYERAGVAGSIAVHFGVNASIAVLSAGSPTVMALMIAIQGALALPLLTTRRQPQARHAVPA